MSYEQLQVFNMVVDLLSKGLVGAMAGVIVGRRTGNAGTSGAVVALVLGAIVGVMAGEVGQLVFHTLNSTMLAAAVGVIAAVAIGAVVAHGVSLLARNMVSGELAGDPSEVKKAMIIGGIGGGLLAAFIGSWL